MSKTINHEGSYVPFHEDAVYVNVFISEVFLPCTVPYF